MPLGVFSFGNFCTQTSRGAEYMYMKSCTLCGRAQLKFAVSVTFLIRFISHDFSTPIQIEHKNVGTFHDCGNSAYTNHLSSYKIVQSLKVTKSASRHHATRYVYSPTEIQNRIPRGDSKECALQVSYFSLQFMAS